MKAELENSVIAKTEYEYERFLLDMQRTSKNNIITKAEEICRKKQIIHFLWEQVRELSEQELNLLNAEDNLLETMYRYAIDTVPDSGTNTGYLQGCVQKILLTGICE